MLFVMRPAKVPRAANLQPLVEATIRGLAKTLRSFVVAFELWDWRRTTRGLRRCENRSPARF